MPRDVATRWNLTFDMLQFALEYRAAIKQITGEVDMKLRNYEMSSEEWDVASELCEVLKVCLLYLLLFSLTSRQIFKDATLFFSRDGTPSLTTVIPAMDYINKVLVSNATNNNFSLSIQAALSMSKKTLNRYYSKTDDSELYQIAIGAFHISLA